MEPGIQRQLIRCLQELIHEIKMIRRELVKEGSEDKEGKSEQSAE